MNAGVSQHDSHSSDDHYQQLATRVNELSTRFSEHHGTLESQLLVAGDQSDFALQSARFALAGTAIMLAVVSLLTGWLVYLAYTLPGEMAALSARHHSVEQQLNVTYDYLTRRLNNDATRVNALAIQHNQTAASQLTLRDTTAELQQTIEQLRAELEQLRAQR